MLEELIEALQAHPAVREKANIHLAYAPALEACGDIPIGDDTAAIPDPATGGHLLFAAEGMIDSFVRDDPWFAGYSAVMVNLSDIAAMGGTPIAITDILWTPDHATTSQIWEGMRAASAAYDVPIVGGHTTQSDGPVHLAASVVGRAGRNLLTSFDAQPGERLVIAIDMRGAYRRDKPFWNASTTSTPGHLQRCLALLPELAESGLCRAAKDISNGGIIGTLLMLCHCSKVGAELDLDRLPRPDATSWLKWLTSFPSYAYLLAVKEENVSAVAKHFSKEGISTADCGIFSESTGLRIAAGGRTQEAFAWPVRTLAAPAREDQS